MEDAVAKGRAVDTTNVTGEAMYTTNAKRSAVDATVVTGDVMDTTNAKRRAVDTTVANGTFTNAVEAQEAMVYELVLHPESLGQHRGLLASALCFALSI
jgi:hypothetical protein